MEEIDVFKSMRESVEDEFSPFVDEKEACCIIPETSCWKINFFRSEVYKVYKEL